MQSAYVSPKAQSNIFLNEINPVREAQKIASFLFLGWLIDRKILQLVEKQNHKPSPLGILSIGNNF